LEIINACYYICAQFFKTTYQERQRDWPFEALATLSDLSSGRRCQLQFLVVKDGSFRFRRSIITTTSNRDKSEI
jgi:hypothetical protein